MTETLWTREIETDLGIHVLRDTETGRTVHLVPPCEATEWHAVIFLNGREMARFTLGTSGWIGEDGIEITRKQFAELAFRVLGAVGD